MRYENLIWDFDGTLFDTYPAMCRDLQLTMEQLGFRFTLEELMAKFTISRELVLAYCGERIGWTAQEVDRVYRDWVKEHDQPKAEPFPHVEEVLARFQAAGGKHFVFTHRSDSVHDYLAEAGLTKYFTEVTSCGTAFARKPAPAGNLYLMEHNGLAKEKTLAIGDRELGVLAARNAGIHACRFSREPVETAAEYQICDFAELFSLLGLERE